MAKRPYIKFEWVDYRWYKKLANIFIIAIALASVSYFVYLIQDREDLRKAAMEANRYRYEAELKTAHMKADIIYLRDKIEDYKRFSISIPVSVTAYNAEVGQTDDTPFITASNTRVKHGICALSKDLEQTLGLKFGDIIGIKVNGKIGYFVFQDRMNERMRRTVDLFLWDKHKALSFGRQDGLLYPVRTNSYAKIVHTLR